MSKIVGIALLAGVLSSIPFDRCGNTPHEGDYRDGPLAPTTHSDIPHQALGSA
jgi:hypothetical protein